jgi:hypothetical protein
VAEWFDREHWEQFERIPRTWSALYQQKPAPETGDLLKRLGSRPMSAAPISKPGARRSRSARAARF